MSGCSSSSRARTSVPSPTPQNAWPSSTMMRPTTARKSASSSANMTFMPVLPSPRISLGAPGRSPLSPPRCQVGPSLTVAPRFVYGGGTMRGSCRRMWRLPGRQPCAPARYKTGQPSARGYPVVQPVVALFDRPLIRAFKRAGRCPVGQARRPAQRSRAARQGRGPLCCRGCACPRRR